MGRRGGTPYKKEIEIILYIAAIFGIVFVAVKYIVPVVLAILAIMIIAALLKK